MIIPVGYAGISVPITHDGIPRSAYITFGVRNDGTFSNPAEVADRVQDAITNSLAGRIDNQCQVGPVLAQVNVSNGPLPGQASSSATGGLTQNAPTPNVAIL